MRGSRPEQAILSRDTDFSKTAATPRGAMIEGVVDRFNTLAPEGLSGQVGRFEKRTKRTGLI